MTAAPSETVLARRGFLTLIGIGGIVAIFKVVTNLQEPSAADDDSHRSTPPKRDKEFPNRWVPRVALPKPCTGCQDAVGGIESIVVAGKRYWFGFSFSADAALSPPIDDERVMAQFASDYMLQTSGAHPPEFWQDLVRRAVDLSELASGPGERTFTGFEVRDTLQEIEAARREQRTAKNVKLPNHLTYLLHAATERVEEVGPFPCAGEWEQAYKKLDHYGNCRDGAMRVVSGKVAPPAGTDYDDALEVIAQYVAYWRRNVPLGWRSVLLRE